MLSRETVNAKVKRKHSISRLSSHKNTHILLQAHRHSTVHRTNPALYYSKQSIMPWLDITSDIKKQSCLQRLLCCPCHSVIAICNAGVTCDCGGCLKVLLCFPCRIFCGKCETEAEVNDAACVTKSTKKGVKVSIKK